MSFLSFSSNTRAVITFATPVLIRIVYLYAVSISIILILSEIKETFLIIDFEAKMQQYFREMTYSSLIRLEKENLTFYQFPLFQSVPGLVHGVFTRLGGESGGVFQGLNLSFSVGDQAGRVAGNRKRVRDLLNLPSLTFLRQVHGTEAVIISNGRGRDTMGTPETETGDILLTDRPGIGLMIKEADCQAVMLVDPRHKALANMHCGWRGNVWGVIPEGIRQMRAVYGTDPGDLLAAIGPSLGPCCAEFIHYREELPEEAWKYQVRPFYFDLWEWSRDQLLAAGVRNENIAVAGICTSCRPMNFIRTGRKKYRAVWECDRVAGLEGLYLKLIFSSHSREMPFSLRGALVLKKNLTPAPEATAGMDVFASSLVTGTKEGIYYDFPGNSHKGN